MLSRLGRLLGLCNDAVYGGSKRRWAGAAWQAVDALASRLVMTERGKAATIGFDAAMDDLSRVLTGVVDQMAAITRPRPVRITVNNEAVAVLQADGVLAGIYDDLARKLKYGSATRRV